MKKYNYHLQKTAILGGYSIASHANNDVSSSAVWSMPIEANTSIVRMYSTNFAYLKWDGDATSTDYDYFIPENSSVDIYNLVGATTISFISDSANSFIRVTEY